MPPNILIIHADQLRADCLGCTGNPDVKTPHIDALAADGVLCTNHFCPFPVCTPSRYSVLSGLYVHQHLGWTNHCTLAPGMPTFPKALREAGYRTAAVGKMHFTPTYLDVGFDTMVLAEQDGNGRWDDDYHRYLRDRGLADAIDIIDQRGECRKKALPDYWATYGAQESDLPEEHHSTTWIADRAMEQMAAWDDDGSNLLMVGFIKPHHPFDPPAPWSAMYDPDALTVLPGWTPEVMERDRSHPGYFPNAQLDEPALRRMMAMYYATISQLDHHVGRLVDQLKRRGLYDNTLVLFTSDHGDYLGFHHLALKGNLFYDPLMRIPLVVKRPGQVSAGARLDGLSSNVDVAPTVLAAAGVEVPAEMAGQQLFGDDPGREFVFAETNFGGNPSYMARSATGKLLWQHHGRTTHFFDLASDPLELHDLAADPAYAGEIARHREALVQWLVFDSPSQVYLDYGAPLCPGDNVLPSPGPHRQAIADYYAQAVQRYVDGQG